MLTIGGLIVFEKVKRVLLEYAKVNEDEITAESVLMTDLGLNSFEIIEMIVRFEDEFNTEIPDRDLPLFVKVGDVVEYIEKKLEVIL